MKKLSLLLLALASSSFIAVAQSTLSLSSVVAPADLDHPAEMEEYELVALDPIDLHALAELPAGEALRFSLQSPLTQKTFVLNRFEQRTSDYATNFRDASDRKLSAQWAGPGANFTIDENFVMGRWQEGGEDLHLEPLWLQVPDAPRDLYVIYKESDLIATDDHSCLLVEEEGYEPPRHDEEATEKIVGECFIVELALASDLLLYQALGNSAASVENFMLGVLADVQTDYDDAFADELRYAVTTIYIATSAATDPWSATTNPASESPPGSFNFIGILPEFTEWGNNGGFGTTSYDVATLWTGRDFDGTTVGIAWTPGACGDLRYNSCQRFTASTTSLRVLWSHELGHNWSADHDSSNGFIMSPNVNATNTWSGTSVSSIENYYNDNNDCFSSCAPPVAAAMTPFPQVYTGSKVPFEDLTEGFVESRTWSFPGGVPATSNLRFPVITYPNPGNYVATLMITSPSGNASVNVNANVATEAGRIKLLSYDTFEENFGELTIDNPDNGTTWIRGNSAGNGGNAAAVVDNFNTDFRGQVDRLQMPVQDLSDLPFPTLEFEYAYRRYNASFSDELRVRVSTDGVTFTEIFRGRENGTQNFATGPDLQAIFIPRTEADWCFTGPTCVTLDLGAFAGKETVFVEIENLSGFGNPMWIDNVILSGEAGGALPVEWLAFNAAATGKTARLDWSVVQDETNAGFHVERAGTAGDDWQPLDWVPATADRATANYSYEDLAVSPDQTYFYRLRQTDNDGQESISAIREVRFEDVGFASISPNPTGTETRLKTPFSNGTYELHNTAGQQMLSGHVVEGTATLVVQELPAGLYFVRLRGDEGTIEVLRLVKR